MKLQLHDVETIEVEEATDLSENLGKPLWVRDIVIKTTGGKFTVTLFTNESPSSLDIKTQESSQ